MANPNPKLENLEKGRGTKPKLGHKSYTVKLDPLIKINLDKIAQSFNCVYGDGGSLSCLLSKIGRRDLMIVESPPFWEKIPDPEELIPDPEDVLKGEFKEMQLTQNHKRESVSIN